MTEYKKLVTLIDKLKEDVDTLYLQQDLETRGNTNGSEEEQAASAPPPPVLSIAALYAIGTDTKAAVASAAPRIERMVAKARETDPDRQMYNEAMCQRIELLFSDFTGAVYRLLYGEHPPPATEGNEEEKRQKQTEVNEEVPVEVEREEAIRAAVMDGADVALEGSAVLTVAERRHDADLLRRAAAEEWAGRVAGDLAELAVFEAQGRQVLGANEGQARRAIAERRRVDRQALHAAEELCRDAQWQCERHRRAGEREWVSARALVLAADAAVGPLLVARVPDPAARAALARCLKALCAALLTMPEDGNIRRLRCNNERLMGDYGHRGVTACPHGNGSCMAAVQAAELLWGRLGYVPQYSAQASWAVPALVAAGSLRDVALPCGRPVSSHEWAPVGFEPYSERLFELREPNPATNSDMWMEWFDAVSRLSDTLGNIASPGKS